VTGRGFQSESLSGRLGRLTAIAAGLWLVFALPAYWLADLDGLEGLSIAGLLCLVPGLLTLFLATLMPSGNDSNAMLTTVLGGTGLRMLFVLVGTMVVNSVRPQLGFRGFVVWLLAFYLAMLLAETLKVLKRDDVKADLKTSHSRKF
jgi:hypothetical protein